VQTKLRGEVRPFKTEEDHQKQSALDDLLDQYILSEGYVSETLELLATITGNKLDIPNIDCTLDKMLEQMRTLDGIVRKAFKMTAGEKLQQADMAA
jgi:hypothetical protein